MLHRPQVNWVKGRKKKWIIQNISSVTIKMFQQTIEELQTTEIHCVEDLYGPAVSALRYEIAEVKQRCSVIGWVTKNLLSRAPPSFGRHVKPLVLAAFAVVSPHQPALARVVGYGPFSLCVIRKESLCPSSGGIYLALS
jgi:hypothetical protein